MKENEIGTTLLEAAIHIHRELGPGLLEAVYEVILARELSDRGLRVQTYLRLTGLKLGYLLNFGEAVLKSGITRCVNGLEEYNPQRLCVSAGELPT